MLLAGVLYLSCHGVSALRAQAPARVPGAGTAHARATLQAVSGAEGRTTLLLTLTVDDGWHVSYRNPGETGLSTRMAWSLPAGVSVSREVWPVPVVTRTEVGVTHTLDGEVPWLIEFDGPRSAEDRLMSLTLRYGVCREVCIPAQLTVQGALPGTASGSPSAVPERLRARLIRDGGVLAARRTAAGTICVGRLPLGDAAALPSVVADTTVYVPVSLSTARRGAIVHGLFMNGVDARALQAGARLLFVRERAGVTARLDFTRPVPECRTR